MLDRMAQGARRGACHSIRHPFLDLVTERSVLGLKKKRATWCGMLSYCPLVGFFCFFFGSWPKKFFFTGAETQQERRGENLNVIEPASMCRLFFWLLQDDERGSECVLGKGNGVVSKALRVPDMDRHALSKDAH